MSPRKKANPEEAKPDQAAEGASAAQSSFEPVSAKDESSKRGGLYIRRDPAGKFDVSILREKTRAEIRELVSSPNFFEATGLKAPEAPPVFDAAWCGTLYDMLARAETLIAALVLKVDTEQAAAILSYTPAEKEALTPPTVSVLNKYAPGWLRNMADEANLAGLLIMINASKFRRLMEIRAQNDTAHGPNGKPVSVSEKEPEQPAQ